MSDLDQDLREMFRRREADVLGPVAVPPTITRRVRRRQATTVAAAVLGILALIVTGLGVRAATNRGPIPVGEPTPVSPGVITTVAGTGVAGLSGDGGPATDARLTYPVDLAADAQGNLYILEFTDLGRVRKVDPTGQISTVISPIHGLGYSTGLAIDRDGNLYVTEGGSGPNTANTVVKVDPAGNVTPIAGRPQKGYSGDGGSATEARLGWVRDIDVDQEGNVYLTDGSRVRRVDTSGVITTIAGTGIEGFSGDGGQARQARMVAFGIFVDEMGVIYVSGGSVVRRVDRNGITTTVAGTGHPGYSGDGGPATDARLSDPEHVWVDSQGNIYILDSGNHAVRRVDADGIITTVVGTGIRGFSGDGGPAADASLSEPSAMTMGADGALYIGDSGNNRVRKVAFNGS